jgi:GDP-L-fucose synthase
LLTAALPELPRPLIVTNSKETTVLALVDEIAQAFEFDGEVQFDESRPDGQLRKPSSPEDLDAFFPGFKFLDLRSGIRDTVEWFSAEYPNVRK